MVGKLSKLAAKKPLREQGQRLKFKPRLSNLQLTLVVERSVNMLHETALNILEGKLLIAIPTENLTHTEMVKFKVRD